MTKSQTVVETIDSHYGLPLIRKTYGSGRRAYFLDNDGESIRLKSITTALGVLDKPALNSWYVTKERELCTLAAYVWYEEAGKTGAEYSLTRFTEEFQEFLGKEREGSRQANQAANLGTLAHDVIDQHTQALINKTKFTLPEGLPEAVIEAYNNWRLWATENRVAFLAAEQAVYSMDLGIAGTYDCLAEIDGELWLIDYKTSNPHKNWPFMSARLQLSFYGIAWESMTGEKLAGVMPVRLSKDPEALGDLFQPFPITDFRKHKDLLKCVGLVYDGMNGKEVNL